MKEAPLVGRYQSFFTLSWKKRNEPGELRPSMVIKSLIAICTGDIESENHHAIPKETSFIKANRLDRDDEHRRKGL